MGRAIASRPAAEGWYTVAAGLSPGSTRGSEVEFRELYVCARSQAKEVIESVAREHGRLDLLVNNAGIQRLARTEEMSWEDWSSVIDVNLHGVFNCLQAAGRLMLAAGRGSIVNIASVAVPTAARPDAALTAPPRPPWSVLPGRRPSSGHRAGCA